MGRKVHPIAIRLSINKTWDSVWHSSHKQYPVLLHEDLNIRRVVQKQFEKSGITKIITNHLPEKTLVKLFCTKPGLIIGQRGHRIESLKKELSKITSKRLEVKIVEVSKPDRSAQALSESIAIQLEERSSFRRAMKQAIRSAMSSGVLGVKVKVSGRLNGADIARSEKFIEGQLPLQTFRANIDYGFFRSKYYLWKNWSKSLAISSQ